MSHCSVSGTVDQDSKRVIRSPPSRLRASYASEGHSDPARSEILINAPYVSLKKMPVSDSEKAFQMLGHRSSIMQCGLEPQRVDFAQALKKGAFRSGISCPLTFWLPR